MRSSFHQWKAVTEPPESGDDRIAMKTENRSTNEWDIAPKSMTRTSRCRRGEMSHEILMEITGHNGGKFGRRLDSSEFGCNSRSRPSRTDPSGEPAIPDRSNGLGRACGSLSGS